MIFNFEIINMRCRKMAIKRNVLYAANFFILQSVQNYLHTNGKCVQNEYVQNKNQLPPLMRDKLIKDVIQYYIENKLFMHHNDFEELAIEICEAFTNERKVGF